MHIKRIDESYTAQAFITTDMDDNQITAFHPGAMSSSHENRVTNATGITIGIVSPDGRDGMIEHAQQFVAADIPFIFDPGQGLPMFNGDELMAFVSQATWVTVNDYEGRMLQERTGKSLEQIAAMVDALVVTKGGEGSDIYVNGEVIEIPIANVGELKDPTGCGDAFRAGLIYGIEHGLDWPVTGRIASLAGAFKIEHHGTQNHKFTMEQFRERYQESFGGDF
jgi:adenosine kinase